MTILFLIAVVIYQACTASTTASQRRHSQRIVNNTGRNIAKGLFRRW